MVKQIQYLMYLCNYCCNFFNKNLHCCFCFWVLQLYFNPLTPMQAMAGLGLPLLASSRLTNISIIYTQAGTKVGPDQLGLPVRVGSTRIVSDHEKT